jgi:lipoate-protein ligase A
MTEINPLITDTGSRSLSTAEWRLILSPPATGAWNMAVDEALLKSMAPGEESNIRSVLRLYAWDPPCLSLGYAQPFSDVDTAALEKFGWDVVRRPTGGRAILHTDELTYAVIGPHSEPRLAGGVLESYRRLSAALLAALHKLSLPAESQPDAIIKPGSDPKGPVCFEVPSNYEITLKGKKLIGSAQSRRRVGVLQHGSLPLYGDLMRITQALSFQNEQTRAEAARRLADRATTVSAGLEQLITWEQAAQAFREAFAETLNLTFVPDHLTPEETARAEELLAQKYGNPRWTERN